MIKRDFPLVRKQHQKGRRPYGWVEKHHILPQNDFGDGETVKLCPNCHRDYHQALGYKNLKGRSIEFHYEKYYRWLYGVGFAIIIAWIIVG